jgi:hypothetical protein
MKPMIWYPKDKDQRAAQRIDQDNHAPYGMIAAVSIVLLCAFTLVFLVGVF